MRISADDKTNSIIITSSLRDYAQVLKVIQQLDRSRRQVFIEAVIMDLLVDNQLDLGVKFHGGAAPSANISGTDNSSLIYGGLSPLTTILPPDPSQLQGFALGIRGPGLNGTTNLLSTGLTIPAFGVLLTALASNQNNNTLATPHILATDNLPASISVGANIPLQTNSGLSGSLSSLGGAAGGLGGLAALGSLGGGSGGRADGQDRYHHNAAFERFERGAAAYRRRDLERRHAPAGKPRRGADQPQHRQHRSRGARPRDGGHRRFDARRGVAHRRRRSPCSATSRCSARCFVRRRTSSPRPTSC